MDRVRVLVVDDAAVVRRLVSDTLTEDPKMDVIGVAANGKIALAKVAQLKPDIILLDLEMPEMDGLETIKELRKTHRDLPVILFSSLSERGAKITLEALSAGANDYVTKPAKSVNLSASQDVIREELIPKIKALCHITDSAIAVPPQPVIQPTPQRSRIEIASKIEAIVIGISTGGPNALEKVIPALPEALPIPIFIVQHMPPVFTKSLAERLNTHSSITVVEAQHGSTAKAGVAYIAPGGFHLVVSKNGAAITMETNQDNPVNSCRPSADVLFLSAAKAFGSSLLGVVMTGMGQDGLTGSDAIVKNGGHVITQDEATSIVWGMPGFVTRAGLSSKVLPLEEIATEVVRRATVGRSAITRN